MRKGECEDSDDGQQQGSIVNVRFPDDDVDGSWIMMIMIGVMLDVAAIMFMGMMKNEDADHHDGDDHIRWHRSIGRQPMDSSAKSLAFVSLKVYQA